jgi:asparagine synthase (glutamine-hydrolysing)
MLSRDFLDSLRGYDPFDQMQSWYDRSKTDVHLSRMQYVDIKTYLCDDILVKVDRASMAHALEVRCPLLDHRVVEYAARIPPTFKQENGKQKLILRRAIRALIPPETFDRKKMGFAIPIAEWFKTALKDPTESLFFGPDASGILARYEARRIWWEHQRGLFNHGTQLWNGMMFELWYRRFIEGKQIEMSATDPMKDHRPTADDARTFMAQDLIRSR